MPRARSLARRRLVHRRLSPRRLAHLLLAFLVAVAGGVLVTACAPGGGDAGPDSTSGTADDSTPGDAAAAPEAAPEDAFATAFAGPIEEAHGADAWSAAETVSADLELDFGGNRVLEGTMTFTPDMQQVRLDHADGSRVYWHDGTAWVTPADADLPRARFNVLTWPYFLAAPMKLRDPGTHLEDLGARQMDGTTYDAARLTFDSGVGDTPDDWYVLYREPESGHLAAMAYIVTYGTPAEQAEQEPHAIRYLDYTQVDGVDIPHAWQFHAWNEEEGVHGDPIGFMKLTSVNLSGSVEDGFFTPPEDAREVTMPQPATATEEASGAAEGADAG